MPKLLDLDLLHYSGVTGEYTYSAVIPCLLEALEWAFLMRGDFTFKDHGPTVVWKETTLRKEFSAPAMDASRVYDRDRDLGRRPRSEVK